MALTSPAKRQSWTASFTAGTMEDELPPSLWQHLPPDLCEKILSKLPLSDLRKFSRVSKRWKALFRSVEFARECESREWTFFYLDVYGEISYMLLPNLKTNSWDKHLLDFLRADEHIFGYHVAADGGLVCYRIRKRIRCGFDPWITLVVQNPLTRKWRRLIVPHQLERDSGHNLIWGLMMDKENGSYKVVVAFFDQDLPRTAFIYDSVSKSWLIPAALTPVLVPHFDEHSWEVRSVVCSRDELLWVMQEWNPSADDLIYSWLIKYNFELDTWSTVTQESPFFDERGVYLVHDDVENRPVMVNFQETRRGMPNSWNLPSRARFPSEFLELVPNLGKFGIEDVERLKSEVEDTEWLASFEPKQVTLGGGTWYIVSDSTSNRESLDVVGVSVSPPTVTRLPTIYGQEIVRLGIFAATLKAFV